MRKPFEAERPGRDFDINPTAATLQPCNLSNKPGEEQQQDVCLHICFRKPIEKEKSTLIIFIADYCSATPYRAGFDCSVAVPAAPSGAAAAFVPGVSILIVQISHLATTKKIDSPGEKKE